MKRLNRIIAAAVFLAILAVPAAAQSPESVGVGGMPFGVRFTAEGVVIV